MLGSNPTTKTKTNQTKQTKEHTQKKTHIPQTKIRKIVRIQEENK